MANAGARYTYVSSQKWNDRWYLNLPPQWRNLFDYFTENGDNTCAGVYQCDLDVAMLKVRPWDDTGFVSAVAAMRGHLEVYDGSWVWVVNYAKYNCQEGNAKAWVGVWRIVREAPFELQRRFAAKYRETLLSHLSDDPDLTKALDAPPPPLEAPAPPLDQSPPLPSIPNHTKPNHTPLVPKTLRVPARSADELQADIDSILAETEHPELYRAMADLMAGANKTGKVAGTRLLTALYEPLWAEERRYRESNLAPAFEEGLRAAVQAGAFAVNYVKRAAETASKRTTPNAAIKRQTAGPRDKDWSEE